MTTAIATRMLDSRLGFILMGPWVDPAGCYGSSCTPITCSLKSRMAFPNRCLRLLKVAEMEKFGIKFGRLVRVKRGVEGLSQDSLAGKSGLTKARISDLENGKIPKPQSRTVDALVVALNISKAEREECWGVSGPDLPHQLLENLAMRFGHSNPDALEDELVAFLKAKATEFRAMQERLANMMGAEGRVTDLLATANKALEEGEFEITDICLAEAEHVQAASITLPALQRQFSLRFERGHAALLKGDVAIAVQHWEAAANYFHFLNSEIESERRFDYCNLLREHGYRYRSVEALRLAVVTLERVLIFWRKEDNLRNWCRVMLALGDARWRLSQFDGKENFSEHITSAKRFYDAVHSSCSERVLPNKYALSGRRMANIYSDREFSSSDEEYYRNMEKSLKLQIALLRLLSKSEHPVDWGISHHNLGLTHIQFFRIQADKFASIEMIDKAILHLDLSFEVRDRVEMHQYWVASCRSIGEALIERSMYQSQIQANGDLEKSYEFLTDAASTLSEEEHPNQWAQVQEQLDRHSTIRKCTNQISEPL